MIVEKIIDLFYNAIGFLVDKLPTGVVQTMSNAGVPQPLKYGA